MILKQYYLGCLAHASYMVGDQKAGVVAVVDPQRDVDQYLADAEKLGVKIRYVILTHFHADFVAGHLELRNRAGATIALGARGQAEYETLALKDGDTLELGRVRLKVIETPGHTPESVSVAVYDLDASADKPHAVFTGDTMFIGDVGRPDLLASVGVTADQLADMLYDSLRKLLLLPDETLVYPAHGAGSLCGKNLSTDTVSNIGVQRKYNYALQPMSRSEFKQMVTADQPEAPPYFAHDVAMNRAERPTLETELVRELKPLTPDEAIQAAAAGAQLLDVREATEFAGAHLAGSLNIGLAGKFATWAGFLLKKDRPIVIIAETDREREAALRLGRIGYDSVVGYLKGGMEALNTRPELVSRIDRVTAGALRELLASPTPPAVIDVRAEKEFADKRIAGAINIPLPHLAERVGEIPKGRAVVVHCAGGYRSSAAASVLQQLGVTGVSDMVGGYAAWEKVASRG